MFCYPTMCLLTMAFYFFMIKDFVAAMKVELFAKEIYKYP